MTDAASAARDVDRVGRASVVCEREIGGQVADAEHASLGEAQSFGLGRGGVFANQRIAARATVIQVREVQVGADEAEADQPDVLGRAA